MVLLVWVASLQPIGFRSDGKKIGDFVQFILYVKLIHAFQIFILWELLKIFIVLRALTDPCCTVVFMVIQITLTFSLKDDLIRYPSYIGFKINIQFSLKSVNNDLTAPQTL